MGPFLQGMPQIIMISCHFCKAESGSTLLYNLDANRDQLKISEYIDCRQGHDLFSTFKSKEVK